MFGLASDRDEQSAVLALVGAAGSEWPWHRIADAIADVGSAIKIIDGDWSGFEDEDASLLHVMAESAHAKESLDKYGALIEEEEADGSHLITVLDSDYPVNLREVYNRPPFLFVRGQLTPADDRAIAVVGTRQATDEGLDQASRLADGLAREGVTVLSGMALGIDTAAHRAALDAGGRTVAVMGTGIRLRYPKQNTDLADRIEEHGALVSQFWPDQPPAGFRFPMRNIVTSGMSLGTVVIEASSTSGAKSQARHALEHGKRVFLIQSLVLREQWAQDYVEKRGAIPIDSVEDILAELVALSRADEAEQLRLV